MVSHQALILFQGALGTFFLEDWKVAQKATGAVRVRALALADLAQHELIGGV